MLPVALELIPDIVGSGVGCGGDGCVIEAIRRRGGAFTKRIPEGTACGNACRNKRLWLAIVNKPWYRGRILRVGDGVVANDGFLQVSVLHTRARAMDGYAVPRVAIGARLRKHAFERTGPVVGLGELDRDARDGIVIRQRYHQLVRERRHARRNLDPHAGLAFHEVASPVVGDGILAQGVGVRLRGVTVPRRQVEPCGLPAAVRAGHDVLPAVGRGIADLPLVEAEGHALGTTVVAVVEVVPLLGDGHAAQLGNALVGDGEALLVVARNDLIRVAGYAVTTWFPARALKHPVGESLVCAVVPALVARQVGPHGLKRAARRVGAGNADLVVYREVAVHVYERLPVYALDEEVHVGGPLAVLVVGVVPYLGRGDVDPGLLEVAEPRLAVRGAWVDTAVEGRRGIPVLAVPGVTVLRALFRVEVLVVVAGIQRYGEHAILHCRRKRARVHHAVVDRIVDIVVPEAVADVAGIVGDDLGELVGVGSSHLLRAEFDGVRGVRLKGHAIVHVLRVVHAVGALSLQAAFRVGRVYVGGHGRNCGIGPDRPHGEAELAAHLAGDVERAAVAVELRGIHIDHPGSHGVGDLVRVEPVGEGHGNDVIVAGRNRLSRLVGYCDRDAHGAVYNCGDGISLGVVGHARQARRAGLGRCHLTRAVHVGTGRIEAHRAEACLSEACLLIHTVFGDFDTLVHLVAVDRAGGHGLRDARGVTHAKQAEHELVVVAPRPGRVAVGHFNRLAHLEDVAQGVGVVGVGDVALRLVVGRLVVGHMLLAHGVDNFLAGSAIVLVEAGELKAPGISIGGCKFKIARIARRVHGRVILGAIQRNDLIRQVSTVPLQVHGGRFGTIRPGIVAVFPLHGAHECNLFLFDGVLDCAAVLQAVGFPCIARFVIRDAIHGRLVAVHRVLEGPVAVGVVVLVKLTQDGVGEDRVVLIPRGLYVGNARTVSRVLRRRARRAIERERRRRGVFPAAIDPFYGSDEGHCGDDLPRRRGGTPIVALARDGHGISAHIGAGRAARHIIVGSGGQCCTVQRDTRHTDALLRAVVFKLRCAQRDRRAGDRLRIDRQPDSGGRSVVVRRVVRREGHAVRCRFAVRHFGGDRAVGPREAARHVGRAAREGAFGERLPVGDGACRGRGGDGRRRLFNGHRRHV